MQIVKWAFYSAQCLVGDMGVYLGSFGAVVPQKRLNVSEVGSLFQQVCGK